MTGTSGGPDPTLRAADADRDAVGDRLRRAHTEGRLTVQEFQERLDAAFAARTLGDLAGLTATCRSSPAGRRRPGWPAPGARVLLARTLFGDRR